VLLLSVALALAGCGGGGGGGGDAAPIVQPNEAPTIEAPGQLSGGPVQYTYELPIVDSQVLTFSATDLDSDVLSWEVAVSAPGAAVAGLTFASPATGSTFEVDLAPVATAVSVTLNVLVEDPAGSVASMNILLVRSGSPVVAGISRSSAFATAPQNVTISGSAFSLGGVANTLASFSGVAADNVTVIDESTLSCTTPTAVLLGANTVSVANQFGSANAPSGAFAMYSYPVDMVDFDRSLDSGGGEQLVTANVGSRMHAAWIEGGAVVLRTSYDGGANWSVAMTLSGAELPSALRIAVDGEAVVVAWIGDATGLGGSVHVRTSTDAGMAFDPAVELATGSASSPAICVSDQYMHCAWMQLGTALAQEVWVASSATTGAVWSAGNPAYSTTEDQSVPSIGCSGVDAWIALRQGPDQQLYTTQTSDGGVVWSPGTVRSSVAVSPDSAPALFCNTGKLVSLIWADDGALHYMVSENAGLGWPTQQSLLRPADLGVISMANAAVDCEGDHLAVTYVAGGTNLAFSRVMGLGAVPEHVTISTGEEAQEPGVALRGNYVFVSWSGGDIAAESARIKLATSTDRGLTFTGPATFGDGGAFSLQHAPSMMIDGARVWLGWADSRGAVPALWFSSTER
jgi:hypothetical protein